MRYRLKAIYDDVFKVTAQIDTPIPLNTPIMFIRMGGRKHKRLGFKRLAPKSNVGDKK
jgi:hypothetical protein